MDADKEHSNHNTDELDDIPDTPLSPNHPSSSSALGQSSDKKQIVRGARACMVCRTAKMRCIGGDDQNSLNNPCNRCRKSAVECRFEKHRRGRKPGSKVSESSKLQRRHEKDHASSSRDDLKSEDASGPAQSASLHPLPTPSYPPPSAHSHYLPPIQIGSKREREEDYMEVDRNPSSSSSYQLPPPASSSPARPYPVGGPFAQPYPPQDRYPQHSHQLPPLKHDHRPSVSSSADGTASQRQSAGAEDDEIPFPSIVLAKEKNRQSFLATVLGPSKTTSPIGAKGKGKERASSTPETNPNDASFRLPECYFPRKDYLPDPVELGLLTIDEAKTLLGLIFEHLNPFVNLFDPELHTVEYLRRESPFLFVALMMAACKFWQPELFKALQIMAYVFATRAFEEQWKSVEVVQAFLCLVYWKEPDDTRTWLYVGYACRLAVELGLNTIARLSPDETVEVKRLRRNRERTYLVLFVHDRSLSMQTGRAWMLQEDDFIRASRSWHQGSTRPEDVIVAAFVQLRRLSAETSDVFHLRKDSRRNNSDVNYEVLLNGCNTKLTAWMEYWEDEMNRVNSSDFHVNLLRFFRLHVRLFLNSLGLTKQIPNPTGSKEGSAWSIQALSLCYTSAKETLQIVGHFKAMNNLRYGQDVITVMSAYAAIFLLRLARRTPENDTTSGVNPSEIRTLIEQTAGAFYESAQAPAGGQMSSAGAAHARFLWTLVQTDREDEMRRTRSESAAVPNGSGNHNRGESRQSAQLDRNQSRSADALTVSTETDYSPRHSMVSHSPVSAMTSSVRSPTGMYPSGPPRSDITIIRPPMMPPSSANSFTSAVDPAYRSNPGPQQTYHEGAGAVNGGGSAYGSNGGGPVGQGQYASVHHPHRPQSHPHPHQQPASSPVMYQQQPPSSQMPYLPEQGYPQSSIDLQTQMMLQAAPANPALDTQYTQQMYEQLGMQGALLHDSVPYIAPAIHPHLPVVGEHGLFGDPY